MFSSLRIHNLNFCKQEESIHSEDKITSSQLCLEGFWMRQHLWRAIKCIEQPSIFIVFFFLKRTLNRNSTISLLICIWCFNLRNKKNPHIKSTLDILDSLFKRKHCLVCASRPKFQTLVGAARHPMPRISAESCQVIPSLCFLTPRWTTKDLH